MALLLCKLTWNREKNNTEILSVQKFQAKIWIPQMNSKNMNSWKKFNREFTRDAARDWQESANWAPHINDVFGMYKNIIKNIKNHSHNFISNVNFCQ